MKNFMGNVSTKMQLLKNLLITILIGIFVGVTFINVTGFDNYYFIVISLILVVLLILPAIISYYNNYWYIKDDKIYYLYLDNYLIKWKYFFNVVFLKNSNEFEKQISVKEIKKVKILVEKQYFTYGFTGYLIKLEFCNIDNTKYIINTGINKDQKEIFHDNLLLISKINNKITIQDDLDIISHITDEKEKFIKYIERKINSHEKIL